MIKLLARTRMSFTAILKNSRSLSSDERFEEVFAEMSGSKWDAIIFNETWRGEKEEFHTLHNGHLWFGSGGSAGKHGVGILLHRRWAQCVHSWRALGQRLGVLELKLSNHKISIVAVYMPHCGYPDVCVEEMYKKVSAIIREARARKRLLLMAGDWNAEVQSLKTDRESDDVVGQYANDCGNQRGDWLRRWATAERMLITNTCFKKRWGQRWTHEQNSTGRRRQIDYIYR